MAQPHMFRSALRAAPHLAALPLAALLLLALGACRGNTSASPPVHPVLDMDFQPKLRTQAASKFAGFADGRAMRLPVSGTVARDSLPNAALMPSGTAGKNADGSWIKQNPLPLAAAVMARGRERFDIFCAPCHGTSGRGGNGPDAHGLVGKRWPVAIPNFHVVDGKDNRVANFTDGEYFDVLSSPVGKNTMPSYAARLSIEDRWAIVHYIRALQKLGAE